MPGTPSRRGTLRLRLRAVLFGLLATGAGHAAPVPSAGPDWRDQVVYFAMIDRFDDGDPRNDDQGTGEYDPADGAKYSGGDLAGLARRVDYIHGLGATALWITPPVANRWWDPCSHYGGYHGYWAEAFDRIDAHFGTLADYRHLAATLHGAGMLLVQDVVVNHTANFLTYPDGWDARDPAARARLVPDAHGRTAPTQAPFDRNDPRDPADRRAAIYHWTPAITDYRDETQRLDWQLADLDDLNTGNPVVRRALRASYGRWIREVGVDAFRVDTAVYVPPAFFRAFLHARDPAAPGVAEVARRLGRPAFFAFGEAFLVDHAYEDRASKRIDAYMRDAHGPLLPGMLDFPLYGALGDVFARGRPTAELGWRIADRMRVFARPWSMVTFLDNHDVDRFRASGSEASLKQALLALVTLPGIPVIYQGTEQGVAETRAAMFRGGYGSGGTDHFDTQAPLYRYVQRAIALRRGDRMFSRGTPTVLRDDASGPGVLAWRMRYGDRTAIIAFNTADHAALLDNLPTGLRAGRVLRGAFAIDGAAPDAMVGASGRLSMELPPRAGLVWTTTARTATHPAPRVALQLAPLPGKVVDDFAVEGRARGTDAVSVVIDGDLSTARRVPVDASGRWKARIDTSAMADPAVRHRVVAWADGVASDAHSFRVARPWRTLVALDDPAGDDAGPSGRYTYPTEPGWRGVHPLDIERMELAGNGGALRVTLTMRGIDARWNPPNGFDHAAFLVYLEVPGLGDGATIMPLQNAQVPEGMRWNLRLRANGFANALFSATGASATAEGTPVAAVADIAVDAPHRRIAFTLPARALGSLRSPSRIKVYATTWDIGDALRPLQPEAGTMAFGGGDGTRDPRVMDDTAVLVVP